MLKRRFALFNLLIFFLLTAQLPSRPIPSQDRELLRGFIQAARFLKSENGEEVWKGYQITGIPIVLTTDQGGIYAFHLKPRSSAWKTVQIEGEPVLTADQDLWGVGQIQMNPRYPVDRQTAFVFHCDNRGGSALDPLFICLHEMFHQHQFSHFSTGAVELKEGYEPLLETESLAWIEMEQRTLLRFFETRNEAAADALKDFAAIREHRVGKMKRDAILWEDHQQKMEGLADYVSMRISDSCPDLPSRYGRQRLMEDLRKGINDPDSANATAKWRHYAVGASIGYALDYLKVKGWKQVIESGKGTMADLLARQLKISREEMGQRVDRMRSSAEYAAVSRKSAESLRAMRESIAEVESGYRKQRGIPVLLGSPATSISGGGSNQGFVQVAGGRMASLEDSSCSSSDDKSWMLEFKRIPFVFELSTGEKEFKLDSSLVVELDKARYPLRQLMKSGGKKRFKQIAWNGNGCTFSSRKYPGTLESDGKSIRIYFG